MEKRGDATESKGQLQQSVSKGKTDGGGRAEYGVRGNAVLEFGNLDLPGAIVGVVLPWW